MNILSVSQAFVHPSAVIGPNVTIEHGAYIGPFCIIGFPAEKKGKENINAGVIIKRGARLTGLVTVDAGTERPTVIGEDCYLMKHSHVGHDAILFKEVTLACGAKIGGHAVIHEYANIGLNASVHQFQTIEAGCMVGMGAVVTKKLVTKPFHTYGGNPAKLIDLNYKHPKYPKNESSNNPA